MTQTAGGFALADAAALIQALPSAVALVYMDGSQVLNAAARARLAGLGCGQDWIGLFHPESVGGVQDALRRAFQGESAHLTVRLPDSAAPGLVTVAPAGPGMALLHLHAARDPLEVALELLDSLGLGMTVQAQDSHILYANAAAQEILGLSLDQLTGRDSLDPRWRAVHPSGAAFPGDSHPAVEALRTGEILRRVPMGVFHPPSESWRWLEITSVPRRVPGAEQPIQVTSVFEDVTGLHLAQAALRHSERRFRSLVEATAQIVWTTDPDGFFAPPQPGWGTFTGQRPDEYEGQGWLAAIHPEDRVQTLTAWDTAVRTSSAYAAQHRLRRADGEYVSMQVRGVPVFDEHGAVHEWVGAHTDVRVIQAAEQSLRLLNTELETQVQERTRQLAEVTRLSSLLLNSATDGVIGVDAYGRVTLANPAALQLLGYGAEALIGLDVMDLLYREAGAPADPARSPVHRSLHDGEVRSVEAVVFRHARGHAVTADLVVTPNRGEHSPHTGAVMSAVTGAVLLLRDSGARLKAHQDAQTLIAEQERHRADLEDFAYHASHDLHDPLRALGNHTHLLGRYRGRLDPHADQSLNVIGASAERLDSLVSDLLSFARIGQPGESRRILSLDRLMRDTEQGLRTALAEGGGRLIWDTPHTVLAQPTLIRTLLGQLVGNALKFTALGRFAEVRVSSHPLGDHVQVSVQDNGIGIAPEYAVQVFGVFQRLHHRETYPGNGMGLAICRRIVERHGGRLWLESTPGQGSTFHFTLPAAPPLQP